MGKKTKKAKATQEHRARHNGTVTLETLGLGPNSHGNLTRRERQIMERDLARTDGGDTNCDGGTCMHGDPVRINWSESLRYFWMTRASCVAHYGQRYQYQSTLLAPNQVPCVYILMHDKYLDGLFYRVAYASAVTELVKEGGEDPDPELSGIKLELAICAEAYVKNGRPNLTFFLEQYRNDPTDCPPWAREMVETMERVRSSQHHAVLFLASKVPCHCLDQAVEEAQAALAASSEGGETIVNKCEHGKPTGQTEAWYKEMECKIRIFASDESNCSPRDFDMLHGLVMSNPQCANDTFVSFCYSLAARLLLDERKYETAENACNFALMANAHAQYGAAQVAADIQAMKDSKDGMKPYLRELYVNFRKTANPSAGLLQFLGHQIPCDCLSESRANFRVEGDASRRVLCVVCEGVAKKCDFKTCSRCKVEQYCSRSCQENDWSKHRFMCGRLCGALKKQQETA